MAADESSLSEEQIGSLRSTFRELDCAVKDLEGASFEISHKQYPVATHVYANPYFLQFSSVIVARPKGFAFRTRSKLYAFLNHANSNAKLARFALDGDKPNANFGGWLVMASVKFVNGAIGAEWNKEVLNNCLNLWLHDVAEFILLPGPFGLDALKR
jgi:hypothetical protein